jgi:nicotinamidase-related amidase
MGDQLLPLPLTERSVHLCVDMQRIFSAEGPWPMPWMDRVLPVAAALANRHPERTFSPASSRPSVPTRCRACGGATTRGGAWRPASDLICCYWS